MATINPQGEPAQGPPMQPVNNPTTVAPQGAPATSGTTLPGSGPQPTNLPGAPIDWSSFPRIVQAAMDLYEQQGKAAADELLAWIRKRISPR